VILPAGRTINEAANTSPGRGGGPKRGTIMKNLMNKDDREIQKRKIGRDKLTIDEYKKRMSDMDYVDHAIQKIATDLAHNLTR
jgi:hypothetical protein